MLSLAVALMLLVAPGQVAIRSGDEGQKVGSAYQDDLLPLLDVCYDRRSGRVLVLQQAPDFIRVKALDASGNAARSWSLPSELSPLSVMYRKDGALGLLVWDRVRERTCAVRLEEHATPPRITLQELRTSTSPSEFCDRLNSSLAARVKRVLTATSLAVPPRPTGSLPAHAVLVRESQVLAVSIMYSRPDSPRIGAE
jgi:hypothetical protein